MKLNEKISKPYYHKFQINKAGLVAISISARCLSKSQTNDDINEDLRIEINGLQCREYEAVKNKQLFNIPASFNGTELKGLKKTIIFIVVLPQGENIINFIPKTSAIIEQIEIKEISRKEIIELSIEEQAEDGDRRPWLTFVLVNLPLLSFSANFLLSKRFLDSDDVKIIVNKKIKKNLSATKNYLWYLTGGILSWIKCLVRGSEKEFNVNFEENLDTGIHYIELWADRMPKMNNVSFKLAYKETKADIRANNIIKMYSAIIIESAAEFNVDPVIVGSVIYQEQSTNVNFVDTLTDYIGGIYHLNTSVGVGQVRVNTAKSLENIYYALKSDIDESIFIDTNVIRVHRLLEASINIRFVTAKIAFSQERWEKAGISIKDKSDILGTLYNIEDIDKPVEPHSDAQANDFGLGVKNNYSKVKDLLGL